MSGANTAFRVNLFARKTDLFKFRLFSLCCCRSYCQTGKGQVWSHQDRISKGNPVCLCMCVFCCAYFFTLLVLCFSDRMQQFMRRNVPYEILCRQSVGSSLKQAVNSFYKPRQGHLFTGTPAEDGNCLWHNL